MEDNLLNKAVLSICEPLATTFDQCVAEWRGRVGPAVQVKGIGRGEPPLQCCNISCLVERCLKLSKYDFEKCKAPMDAFKRCVKGLYGKEYVD